MGDEVHQTLLTGSMMRPGHRDDTASPQATWALAAPGARPDLQHLPRGNGPNSEALYLASHGSEGGIGFDNTHCTGLVPNRGPYSGR